VAGTHTDTGLNSLLAEYAQRARASRDAALINPSSADQALSTGWILNGLAQARLNKFTRLKFNSAEAPVKLTALAALFAAWRSTRITNHPTLSKNSAAS
ncbi:MAG: hypothetical protein ACRER7_04460, partial [Gammaproteobacteria bacterium]